MLIYLFLCGTFALGWILRGMLCARQGGCDAAANDQVARLEARLMDLEASRLLPPTQDWARRQGLLP